MMDRYDTACVGKLNTSVVEELAKDLPLYMAAIRMSAIWQPAMIIGGLLGNILIVIVMMSGYNRWSSCSNYIAVLAVSDSVALLRKSMDHMYTLFGTKYNERSCAGWVYVALTACQFSMLLVMCMTVDRLIAVKYHNRQSIYCSVGRARRVMLVLLIVALFFNIPHLFMTVPISDGKYCAAFGESHKWSFAYGWLQVIVNFVIPVISLTTMTVIIVRTLSSNRRKTDDALQRRSSKASQNFEVYITRDPLAHIVLSFIADSLKSMGKQISTSSINISCSKNQKGGQTELGGKINEAYIAEQRKSNSVDGLSNDNKSSSEGRSMADEDSLAQDDQIASLSNHLQQTVDIPDSQSMEMNAEREDAASQSQNDLDPINSDHEAQWKDDSETSAGVPQEESSRAVKRQTSKEKPNQLNVVLFLVVFFFVLLTVPQHIRYIVYNFNFVNRWMCPKAYATYVMVYHISNKAYFTNCAINFYLYFCGSSLFRNSIKDIFTCCCRRRKQAVWEEQEEQDEQKEQRISTVSEQCDIQLANVMGEDSHIPASNMALAQPAEADV